MVNLTSDAVQRVTPLDHAGSEFRIGLALVHLRIQKLRENHGQAGSHRLPIACEKGESLDQVTDDSGKGEIGAGGRGIAPGNLNRWWTIEVPLDPCERNNPIGLLANIIDRSALDGFGHIIEEFQGQLAAATATKRQSRSVHFPVGLSTPGHCRLRDTPRHRFGNRIGIGIEKNLELLSFNPLPVLIERRDFYFG